MLGPVEAWTDERPVALGGPRQVALLAFLLLHANRAVSADALIDAVWGDEREGAAKRLHMGVLRLRRALAPLDGEDGPRLRTVGGGYRLSLAPGELDATVFAELVRDGRLALEQGDAARAGEVVDEALGLWRGPPLAEVGFEEFAQAEIRRLEELRLVAVETRVEADLERGRHAEVIAELEGLLAEEPTRERAAGQLMTALYRSGRQSDALDVYQRVRAALAEQLGLEPGPALRELQGQILAQDHALDRRAVQSVGRSNLPTPANPLVGRTEEMSRALELLSHPDVRLLTLLGPGGSGKTRLALEIAAAATARYRDGAWIVLLAPIPDRAVMVSELARILEVSPVPGEQLEPTLLSALSEREMLLVLDNFEHLLDAGGLVAGLLASAPGVDVLATSREPLRIRAEQRMDVPPLPSDAAAELFLARARAVRPDLSIDDEDRQAVDRICVRLDGLPLALELAAARVAAFAPRRLEARLAQRLALPEGPLDLPERQRTLRATIGWSYQLLEAAERSVFEELSPFIGGVRTDSTEAIWGAPATDRVISLMEKSLLRRREDPDGELRLWMLETVREFVLERAATDGVAAEAARRHADYFFSLAEEAAPHVHRAEARHWLDRLESDQANLRAALDYLSQQEPSRALAMATNLAWFWDHRGYHGEALGRLTDLLELTPSQDPARGPALVVAGRFRLKIGELALAKSLLLESLPIVSEMGDERSIVLVHAYLGWADGSMGDDSGMAAHYERAIEVARAVGDDWALGLALNGYGSSKRERGDSEGALSLVMEALSLFRRIGDAAGTTHTSITASEIAIDLGDLDVAETLNAEALARARDIEFRPGVATALCERALIRLLRDDVDRAEVDLRAGIQTSRQSDTEMAADALAAAATVAAIRREGCRAATLWAAAGRARSIPESVAVERLRTRWEPQARQAVDQADWDAATAAGTELTLEDALALAAGADPELSA